MRTRLTAGLLSLSLLTLPVLADDWVAVRVDGDVQQMVADNWVDLKTGNVVSDDRRLRTLASGKLDLQRGKEVVTLGADTEVQIVDRAGERYTTVKQAFGAVEIEAEVEAVQHFAVETSALIAVVKGTHFIVRSDGSQASVTVQRGQVAVELLASHSVATVGVGQTATVRRVVDVPLRGSASPLRVGLSEALATTVAPRAAGATTTLDLSAPDAGGGSVDAHVDLGDDSRPAAAVAAVMPQAAGPPIVIKELLSTSGPADSAGPTVHIDLGRSRSAGSSTDTGDWSNGEFGWLIGAIGILAGVVCGGVLLLFQRLLA